MANKTHHVVPGGSKGGWDVKKGGADKASSHYETKQDAVKAAREISKNQKTELVIHNSDGKIGPKDSHGNDPRKVKG
jgi:uncharacterized protein YdaT